MMDVILDIVSTAVDNLVKISGLQGKGTTDIQESSRPVTPDSDHSHRPEYDFSRGTARGRIQRDTAMRRAQRRAHDPRYD